MALKDEVEERYPSLIPLLSQPEIGRLLSRAVNENWSPGKFQSAFIASHWFRTRSEPQRRWWILTQTDPAEANRQRAVMGAEVKNLARSLGVGAAVAKQVTERALSSGMQPDDAWIKNYMVDWLMRYSRPGAGHVLPQGALRTTVKQVGALARDGYFMAGNENWIRTRSAMALKGQLSMDDIENELRELATKRYPHMAQQLAAGQSVADIIGPYRQLVAEEWGMAPEQINVRTDPKWRQLLGIRDPKSGKTRLPTESEVIRMSRTGSWGTATVNGRRADAEMTASLLSVLGKRKSS